MADPISIIIVDDHSIFRSGVVQAFDPAEGMQVIAEGATSEEAIALAEQHRPAIALIDVSMPGGGIAAAREIRSRWPEVRIIMLPVSEDEDVVLRALEAGASGYALKGVAARDLVGIVRAVADGQSYVPPNMAMRLVTAMQSTREGRTLRAKLASLSLKEERTLRLLVRGFSNQEIADATGVQVKTVKFHVSNILAKLDARSRTEAALIAQKNLID